MTLILKSEKPPLRQDKTGRSSQASEETSEDATSAIRVGKSRVLLEMVIYAFQDGTSPETIIDDYPTLTLSDVYGAIAFYLKNKD
ncbi:MAG: DUF433 domain-containing protein, partial [Cyanobacteria bacterium P01_A01_bin.83]